MRIVAFLLLFAEVACHRTFESDVVTPSRCMAVTTTDKHQMTMMTDHTVDIIKDAIVASAIVDMMFSDNPEEEAAIGLFALLIVATLENCPEYFLPIFLILLCVPFLKRDQYEEEYPY